MRIVIKAVARALSFLFGLVIFLAITRSESAGAIAFSPITGLMKAYYELENTALAIVPDGVEELVERLASALDKGLRKQ